MNERIQFQHRTPRNERRELAQEAHSVITTCKDNAAYRRQDDVATRLLRFRFPTHPAIMLRYANSIDSTGNHYENPHPPRRGSHRPSKLNAQPRTPIHGKCASLKAVTTAFVTPGSLIFVNQPWTSAVPSTSFLRAHSTPFTDHGAPPRTGPTKHGTLSGEYDIESPYRLGCEASVYLLFFQAGSYRSQDGPISPAQSNLDSNESALPLPASCRAFQKRCVHPACPKISVSRGLCRGHGGGRRCHVAGCTKSAQSRSMCCWAHGGGQRCEVALCMRSRKTKRFCVAHVGLETATTKLQRS